MRHLSRRSFLELSASTATLYAFNGLLGPARKPQSLYVQQGAEGLDGYASATSVFPGEILSFHVRALVPHNFFHIDIYRKGKDEVLVDSRSATALPYETPPNAYEIGCGWPSACDIVIPDNWSSGVYIARLTSFAGNVPLGATTEILFVVKAAAPGTSAQILFQLTSTTYEAYNPWGGGSLYSEPPAHKVSLNRPGYYNHFYLWELPFIAWLENNGFEVEYCTSIDLHVDARFLESYQLLLSVGHDEYWSKEMRDNVEAFIANGGNVAFFSGNVCWWQVRFEDDYRTMVCYKDNDASSPNRDPIRGIDDSRATVTWGEDPVNRPENYMTGVSFRHGAGWWTDVQTAGRSRPPTGYQVRQSQHWAFDSTGFSDGEKFGFEESIVGYETDAALYREVAAIAAINNKIYAATRDNKLWWRSAAGEDARWAEIGHANEIVDMAVMDNKLFAVTWRNRLLWRDLVGEDVEWEDIGSADDVIAMTAINDKLFAATWDNRLLWRDPVGEDIGWETIGHANSIVAMAAINDKLFAATSDNRLWWRDPVGEDIGWETIGHANSIVAMAAINDKLFAATSDNRLWWRDPVGEDIGWETIGHACERFLEVSGEDGTPLNFVVLATADLTDWGRGGQAGLATMGIYRNNGTVFTAGTTDWSLGLAGPWNSVQKITQNILRRLSCPCPPSPRILNSSFEIWTDASVPDHWTFEGSGRIGPGGAKGRTGLHTLAVNASAGETWVSQGPFSFDYRSNYRIGCWVWANGPGATVRLQETSTYQDFAIAEHSGNSKWEYLSTVGKFDSETVAFPVRVKLQVATGTAAYFDDITLDSI